MKFVQIIWYDHYWTSESALYMIVWMVWLYSTQQILFCNSSITHIWCLCLQSFSVRVYCWSFSMPNCSKLVQIQWNIHQQNIHLTFFDTQILIVIAWFNIQFYNMSTCSAKKEFVHSAIATLTIVSFNLIWHTTKYHFISNINEDT